MSEISIITPAYNAEKLLADTVKSVLEQTFVDWEMIIVDDCSTDDTYDKASRLAAEDGRIKVLRHEKNLGVAAARNTALDAACGDYIAFLDSDDKWVPDKLEKQLAFMKTNGYVLTYTAYRKFDSGSGAIGKPVRVPRKMTFRRIYCDTSIACLTVMVDRKTVGAFHMPPLNHTEDQCTWQDILSRGYNAYGLCEALALYRVGNESLTGNKKKAAKKQWSTYREYFGFSLPKSLFYFSCYAFNALKKHLL